MSNIICPANFNAKLISISAPRQLSSGAKQAYISYGGEKLMMQTALSMTAPFGLNIADKFGPPEYSIDLSFRGYDQRPELKEFMDAIQQLDDALINEGVKNARAWFKTDSNRDVVKAFYTPSLKYSRDQDGNIKNYPPTIKLKLRKYDGVIETKFYDVNGKPYHNVAPEELLAKGVQVTAIMECAGVWFAGSKFGVTWRAKQIAIHKMPEKMGDFAFKGLSAAPASVEDEKEESASAEVDDDAVFARRAAPASVVAAVLPQSAPVAPVAPAAAPAVVAAPVEPAPVAVAAQEEAPSSVQDDNGDDIDAVPVPRRTIVKKKVVAPASKK
jgi:hypothetical protein